MGSGLRFLPFAGVFLACVVTVVPAAFAQREPLGSLPAMRERVVPPPARYASAEEHYNALLKNANGGTKHTVTSLPDWSGIWQSGIATMSMARST